MVSTPWCFSSKEAQEEEQTPPAYLANEMFKYISHIVSLRRIRNQTPVSNICKAAPRSLFRAPNGLNENPEVRFEFPFNLTSK